MRGIVILQWVLLILAAVIGLHMLLCLARKLHKFPIPAFMTRIIDNPLRHRIQPPRETARRHGIEPGMTLLDVGPGNGTYTIAAAHTAGESGKVVAVDIEPKVITHLDQRIQSAGIANLEARVADVYELPFEANSFDVITLIAVIGEIPHPVRAMQEFHRVLVPNGKLVFSELFLDPDYPRAATLRKWAEAAHFRLEKHVGNWFYYTLIFEKV